jgi:hypothetical protein
MAQMGWRLVGDTPNLKHLGERRIEAIQRTTRGVVAFMPYDASSAEAATSPHILDEARLALQIGKPLLLLAEPGVAPPDDVVQKAFHGKMVLLAQGREARGELAGLLEEFDETLEHVQHDDTGAFVFFAGSLRDDASETEEIASVIERSSNMRCVRGERVAGNNVQATIIDMIRRAAVVIADVSDNHRNTLIEAGVALGSGTPLKLICREPPEGQAVKKRFMFEGQEFFWYRTPEERLGLCCYFARQFRRRVYVFR